MEMKHWTTVNATTMVTLFGGFAHHVMEFLNGDGQSFGPHYDPELGVNYMVRRAGKKGEFRVGTNTIDSYKLTRRIERNR